MANPNGASPYSRVFEFRNESSTWIVWSVGHDPPTPRAGSAAAAWSTLKPCTDLAPVTMFTKATAANVAKLLRTVRQREGLVILRDRDFVRPGPPKPVGGCRSIRSLAKTLGVSYRRARAICADSGDDAVGGSAVR
jgi:hypothetical protein